MVEPIKILATKRTCKGYNENEYDIQIEATFENKIKVPGILKSIYLDIELFSIEKKSNFCLNIVKKPYGNNNEIRISIANDKGIWVLSDKDHYTKELINKIVSNIKEFIPVEIVFEENEWTPSKAWNINLSKQITVKLSRPMGIQVMGSSLVEEWIFTIDNTPPKNMIDYGEILYENIICTDVVDIVHQLFYKLDILGAKVKVDGKTLSYTEAQEIKPRNIKLIEIFL